MTCLADKHLIPKELKKTTKYTDEDRERVRSLHKGGMSIHSIVKEVGMSRRMVQFVLYPERALLAKQNFAKRQKDKRYRLPTAEQSRLVRECRHRKRAMLDKLIVK